MARCVTAFVLAEILFVIGVASQPLEEDLEQIIKHLQVEGIEFKRRLGILEGTVQAQKVHIQKQDRRIGVLENIIEVQTDEISSQGLIRQLNSDVEINTISKEHRNDETEEDMYSKQKTPKLPLNNIDENARAAVGNAQVGERTTKADVVKDSETGKRITKNKHRTSRSMMNTHSPVAFQAFLSQDTYHIGKHQTIIFDSLITSIGGGYHSHHGLFTAPKSGMYMFSVSLLLPSNNDMETEIMKNGQSVKGILGNSENIPYFAQASGTVVLQLSTGDEVWVETTEWSLTDVALRSGHYTSFMGCLIMGI